MPIRDGFGARCSRVEGQLVRDGFRQRNGERTDIRYTLSEEGEYVRVARSGAWGHITGTRVATRSLWT